MATVGLNSAREMKYRFSAENQASTFAVRELCWLGQVAAEGDLFDLADAHLAVALFANSKYSRESMSKVESLKPQDVLVACKLHSLGRGKRLEFTYANFSESVGLAPSEVHASVGRCRCAQLLSASGDVVLNLSAFRDLLVDAVPRIFYPVRGGLQDGMPTSVHAPVLWSKLGKPAGTIPVVWPGSGGTRGESLQPIYSSAPVACRSDECVYEVLALLDVIRIGAPADKRRAVDAVDHLLGEGRRASAACGGGT